MSLNKLFPDDHYVIYRLKLRDHLKIKQLCVITSDRTGKKAFVRLDIP